MTKKLLLKRHGWCALRAAGLAVLAMSAAACGSSDDPPDAAPDTPDAAPDAAPDTPDAAPDAAPDTPDAAPDAALPSEYVVRGMALGVPEPVTLQLVYPGGTERLLVSGDGPFAFEARLALRAPYAVTFEGTPPCVLESASGTIVGVEPEIFLACEGAPLLENLILSGPSALDVSVSLARTEYGATAPLMQESVTLTPVARWPGATITIAGAVVASGMPSQVFPLNLGANEIEIEVAQSGLQRTYRVTIQRAATGVDGDQASNSAANSGAVYVFQRTGSTWAQEAYVKASNTGASDQFGASVALAGDTLAVGAAGEASAATGVGGNQENDSAAHSGAVYVFRRTGSTWAQEAYVKASNTGVSDRFGSSVALSGDMLAVAATGEASAATGIHGDQADDSASNSGAVYVFRRTGSTWAQAVYLKASNTGAHDFFGRRLALTGDTLAVGGPYEDSAATGDGGSQADDSVDSSGAVYVFH